MDHLPATGTVLEVALQDGRSSRLVVQSVSGKGLTLAAPADDAQPDQPAPDTPVMALTGLTTLGWLVGSHWYAAEVRTVQPAGDKAPRWRVELADEPYPRNRRRFMRGGGGEPIQISDLDPGGECVLVTGTVVDLSEGGLRCQVPSLGRARGDEAVARICLRDVTVEVTGQVHDTRRSREAGLEAVLVYALDEAEAQLVRRYLFQRELAVRRAYEY